MAFSPPIPSQALLKGIPFEETESSDVENSAKDRYDKFDTPGNRDKNMCKALCHFPDGTVFWSSKMSVDADGPAAPDDPRRRSGKQLDPDSGQDETSFVLPSGGGLPSDIVPYIIRPRDRPNGNAPFHPQLKIGDVAVVIYKDQKTAAICGDLGPFQKIGEGSICLHEQLRPAAPDPCKNRRDSVTGFCRQIFDSSIEEDVLFFIFPGSAFGRDLALSDLTGMRNRLQDRAFALFEGLRKQTNQQPQQPTAKQEQDAGADTSAKEPDPHGSSNPHPKPLIKEFIESPNHSSRNGANIEMVVLHCTEASLNATLTEFKNGNPGRQVSAHYVIDKNGDIYQMVRDSERANHCRGANQNSIGIEHVAKENEALTDDQAKSSAALIGWLLEQYKIPREKVFGHDFTPGYNLPGGTTCPDKLFGPTHSQATVATWVKNNVA